MPGLFARSVDGGDGRSCPGRRDQRQHLRRSNARIELARRYVDRHQRPNVRDRARVETAHEPQLVDRVQVAIGGADPGPDIIPALGTERAWQIVGILPVQQPDRECGWTVELADGQPRGGTLPRGAFRWTSFDIDRLPDDRTLRVMVEGSSTADLAPLTDGLDPRVVSVGLAGFFLCAKADIAARARFLECVALSTLDPLAFNREPLPAWEQDPAM